MYFGGNVSQRIKKLTNLDVQFFILSLKFFKNHFSVILKIKPLLQSPCNTSYIICFALEAREGEGVGGLDGKSSVY